MKIKHIFEKVQIIYSFNEKLISDFEDLTKKRNENRFSLRKD